MNQKNIILIIAIILIIGAIVYLEKTKPNTPPPENINTETIANNPPDLAGIAGFINTPNNQPISIKELIGKKVILVDFWTYSCINCLRTQPYLNDWYNKYRDDGLEIIGIHTPEFEFEKDYDNVKEAVMREEIKYPVALDNDYATWRAYGNKYWPRKYIIDLNGQIVYDHIGEGAYAETESKIQELLKAPTHNTKPITQTEPGPDLLRPDFSKIKSPEIYFGSDRFDPNWGVKLNGSWKSNPEFITNQSALASIEYDFEAKDVFMVAAANKPTWVTFYIDGVARGGQMVEKEMLYLAFSDKAYGKHRLTIEAKEPGLKLYTLTFN